MARIEKRNNGAYLIRVYIGTDINNKLQFKNTTYHPKATTPKAIEKEVKQYAIDFEKKVKRGAFLSGEELSFKDYYSSWLKDIAPKYLSISEIENYSKVIERVFITTIGNVKLSNINPLQLQSIVTSLESTVKPVTIKRYFSILSSVLNRATKLKIIKDNPVRNVILPQIKNNPTNIHFFDIHQAKTFLKCLDNGFTIIHPKKAIKRKNTKNYSLPQYEEKIEISKQFKALFYLAIYSGCRRGELLALTWKDIDPIKNLISITKATATTKQHGQIIKEPKTKGSIRRFPIPSICFEILEDWKQEQIELCKKHGNKWLGSPLKSFDDNYIFIQDNGSQMHLSTPTHKFKEIIEYYNASVENEEDKLPMIHLHDLRHTNASLLIASGIVDIETIARRLGHTNVSMTLNRYGHALPSQDEKACNTLERMLDLNNDNPIETIRNEERKEASSISLEA